MSFADDDGLSTKKRGADEADLDITPMIDVTFLLLIFFMVTSTMQATPDLDVPPAKNGVKVDTGDAIEIQIAAPESAGGDAAILIDGRDASLDDVRAFVQEGIQLDKNHVIIMADREVPHGFVTEVEKAVAEEEGVYLHIGVRDKKE